MTNINGGSFQVFKTFPESQMTGLYVPHRVVANSVEKVRSGCDRIIRTTRTALDDNESCRWILRGSSSQALLPNYLNFRIEPFNSEYFTQIILFDALAHKLSQPSMRVSFIIWKAPCQRVGHFFILTITVLMWCDLRCVVLRYNRVSSLSTWITYFMLWAKSRTHAIHLDKAHWGYYILVTKA